MREGSAIVTTEPLPRIVEVHDRLPLIVSKEDWATWLDGEKPAAMLEGFESYPRLEGRQQSEGRRPALQRAGARHARKSSLKRLRLFRFRSTVARSPPPILAMKLPVTTALLAAALTLGCYNADREAREGRCRKGRAHAGARRHREGERARAGA
jgi:hypothetical protein